MCRRTRGEEWRDMNEYEVDLREYLRVLWRRKWLVVLTLVVALGATAAITLRAPDTYRAEALIAVQTPLGMPAGYAPPSLDYLLEKCKGSVLLTAAAQGTGVSSSWLAENLQARKQGQFLELSLQTARPPGELQALLAAVVAALEEELREGVRTFLETKERVVGDDLNRLLAEREGWQRALAETREQAEAKREELLTAIGARRADETAMRLSVGDAATVRAYAVQKELDVLFARPQAVELVLDDLDRLGLLALPGAAARVPSLEASIQAANAEQASLQELLVSPPTPLVVVRGAMASTTPLRPSLKMNLAVAGVLGLFAGVVLAFFVHWLRASPPAPAGPSGSSECT